MIFPTAQTPSPLLEAKGLWRLLRADGVAPVVIDCRFDLLRPRAGFDAYRAGHIPGARYAHLDQDLAGPTRSDGVGGRHPLPNASVFARRLRAWGVHPDSLVVVYDDAGGAIAARLWWLLRFFGHRAVSLLNGGVTAWREAGLPLEVGVGPSRAASGSLVSLLAEPGSIDPGPSGSDRRGLSPSQMPVVNAGALCDEAAGDQTVLVDARTEERFAGRAEPIDRRAGHIPGAINRPFMLNLAEHGRFKPAEQLRLEFRKLLDTTDARRVVHMCGSGVTACHNLLAMEQAGLAGSALYVGSWSDWISDDRRPREP